MKQFLKYSCLVMLACLSVFTANGKVFNIDLSSANGELTQYLRNKCKLATRDDTVKINIGRGEYTINGTVEFKCNVVIRGAGREASTIILNNGSDKSGFKAFTDDTFLMFFGVLEHPISVDISDVTFRLKEHKGIWWNETNKSSEKLAVKIYHANHVDIRRVNSYMSNAVITNFDMRVCSNVTVTDCIISNYNNTHTGGNLWMRGNQHNIRVTNNKFYKYGNDEAIGVYSNLVNAKGSVRGNASHTDIFIEDNEVHYGYDGKDKAKDLTNNTLFTIQAGNEEGKWVTHMRNVHVKNNKFYINDECNRCFLVILSENDHHKDISFEGNQIVNKDLHSANRYYRQDFDIRDKCADQDTIYIVNNSVTNGNSVLNPYNTMGYSFLLLQGGNVAMTGNRIVSTVTVDPFTRKDNGVQLVWCGQDGGILTMRDNVCKGVKCVATVGAGKGTKHFKLDAFNNYITGDTRVYCHQIENLDLNFTGNTLVCDNTSFFLQEFAQKGSVIFNNNDVTVSSGDGRFMTHWSNASTDSMKFSRLEVKNNVFRGVKGEQDMFKKVTNVKKRTIKSNKYGR